MAGNAETTWAITKTDRIVNECKRFAKKHGWINQGEGHIIYFVYLFSHVF